jgi:hypothetical protein
MFEVQVRRIEIRDIYGAGNGGPDWSTRISFGEWNADSRMRVIRLMQEVGFVPYYDVVLLVDELRPGYTDNPFENILTTDDGMQIRVVPAG